MIERWYRRFDLTIPFEKFERMPINPFYKYEYADGQAQLTPRPKFHSAELMLQPGMEFPDDMSVQVEGRRAVEVHRKTIHIRPLSEADWSNCPPLFAAAFHSVLPFQALDRDDRNRAATDCLAYTRRGGDGPVITSACRVAEAKCEDGPNLYGAALITLFDVNNYGWYIPWESATEYEITKRLGIPHLTWIFVAPLYCDEGVGTALLADVVNGLLEIGYTSLCSTFIRGNDTSLLWHWRNGFRLLPYDGSQRVMHRRINEHMRAVDGERQPEVVLSDLAEF